MIRSKIGFDSPLMSFNKGKFISASPPAGENMQTGIKRRQYWCRQSCSLEAACIKRLRAADSIKQSTTCWTESRSASPRWQNWSQKWNTEQLHFHSRYRQKHPQVPTKPSESSQANTSLDAFVLWRRGTTDFLDLNSVLSGGENLVP